MTDISILTSQEQRKFDAVPLFSKDQRRVYFTITRDMRSTLSGSGQPAGKLGFVLQMGYFKASGRFYPTRQFRARDIDHVCKQLRLPSVDLIGYEGTVVTRHRQRILTLLGWSDGDDSARTALATQALQLASHQARPRQVFTTLVDYCWKQRIALPRYYELAEIISRGYNQFEATTLEALDDALSADDREKLERLLDSSSTHDKRHGLPIFEYRRIPQSLHPGAIQNTVQQTMLLRDHFFAFQRSLQRLALTDRATEYYATWVQKADRQQLLQFTNRNKVYLHALAFIKHQYYLRQDALVDIVLKSVANTLHGARKDVSAVEQTLNAHRDHTLQALSAAHKTSHQLLQEIKAIVQATRITPNEKVYKIEQLFLDAQNAVDTQEQAYLDHLDSDVQKLLGQQTRYTALQRQSRRLQRRVAGAVMALEFDPETSAEPLLVAVRHFQATRSYVGKHPPLDFLSPQECEHVQHAEGFNVSLYKCLLFIHLASALKSGDINLLYSYRYRSVDRYLIDRDFWVKNRERLLRETGLERFADGEQYLQYLKQLLDAKYHSVNKRYLADQNPYLTVGDTISVRTPATEDEHKRVVAHTLRQDGFVPILQVLREVDHHCRFTECFEHFSIKNVKMRPAQQTILAGLIGKGCNIGINKLANISSGVPEHLLVDTVNWCFALKNIQRANKKIVDVISKLALANNYLQQPGFMHSSSDGRKVTVAVDSLHANYSYKYFGQDKGVTMYTFIDERQALFYSTVISASDREAAFVIDGLLQNDIPEQRIHSTDTHGFTEAIFAATHLIDTAFAPRIKNVGKQTLYAFSARRTYSNQSFVILPSRTINQKLILRHWDDILRFMVTIKSRHSTASQLFKRLSSYALDNPLYRALKEFGRIIKSQFILTWYDDVEWRQRIQKQLNRIELSNKFSHAVFFDEDESFQEGSPEDQEMATACKVLLQNAIVLWNYLYLSNVVLETEDEEDRSALIESIQQGSVITWQHINMRGQYDFTDTADNDERFDLESILSLKIK